jgi:phosphate transport system protein
VEVGVDLQAVGKSFERMADHATNLAEQVVYLVEATDVRHREVRHREP